MYLSNSSIIIYNNAFFPPFLKNDPNLAGERSVALRLSLSSLSGSSVGYSSGFLTISSSSSSNSPGNSRYSFYSSEIAENSKEDKPKILGLFEI